MGYRCKRANKECDACGACSPRVVMKDAEGKDIYEGEQYYDFDGYILNQDAELWRYLKDAEG